MSSPVSRLKTRQGLYPCLPSQKHGPGAGGGSLMRERGDVLVGLMVVFLLAFSLGSLVHVAPRFAGSLTGGILGMGATLLMLLTLPYVAVKHISWLDRSSRLAQRNQRGSPYMSTQVF
jgi:hypothetical protein